MRHAPIMPRMISPVTIPSLPCYLNGAFTSLDQARISVLDRGFIFGDGIYEVVPVYQGEPFRLGQHLARLNRSLAEVRIQSGLSDVQWRGIIDDLIKRHAAVTQNSSADQLIYIQISRGVAMRDHVMTPGIAPTIFVMINALKQPGEKERQLGVDCITAEDFRWERAHIKSTSLLGAVFARQMSHDVGATETVMFRKGYLSEAAASNVWVVSAGKVLGTPPDNLVLEGIRYGLIEELCAQQKIAFELRRITREEVFTADELLLSSATKEILPIVRLDGRPVGSGKPGPVYRRLFEAYQRAKAQSHKPPKAAP